MARLLSSTSVPGSLILQARLRTGLSQSELAEQAGISQSAIAAYERGTKDPGYETLSRVLRAAGFDLRLRLAPHDEHDESLATWRQSLPATTRERFQRDQRHAVVRAKKDLGFS